MAWTVKYRIEFDDILELPWKIDISEDAWAGGITDLVGGSNPLTFIYNNSSDDLFDPIRNTTAEISAYSTEDFALIDLNSVDNQQFLVEIYQNSSIYFTGFINTESYREMYGQTPYVVTASVDCGLKLLKSIPYDNAGTPYTGRKSEIEIIRDCLGKLGSWIATFYEYVNVYDDEMDITIDDSPFEQCMIETSLFAGKSCAEVLYSILGKYNAIIRQSTDSKFKIIRPIDLKRPESYGRRFTGDTTKTSNSYTPLQYIDRTTNTSNIKQVGGVLMIQKVVNTVTSKQDYGYRDSWINNNKFPIDSFTVTGGVWPTETFSVDSWNELNSAAPRPVNINVSDEKYGVMLHAENTGAIAGWNKAIWQQFGTELQDETGSTQNLHFDFEYATFNHGTSVINNYQIKIAIWDTSSNAFLKTTGSVSPGAPAYTWNAGSAYIDINLGTIPVGWSNWQKSVGTVAGGLDVKGPYYVYLYNGVDSVPDAHLCYKNVNLYNSTYKIKEKLVESFTIENISGDSFLEEEIDSINQVGRVNRIRIKEATDLVLENIYIKDNNLQGKDFKYNYIIGDVLDTGLTYNIIEQFKGSLGVTTYATLTETATLFDTTFSAAYTAGGVTLTSAGADLIFTAAVAGVDFTGASTITNVTGDLAGTVVNTTPNITGCVQIDHHDVTGTVGTADVLGNGANEEMTFATTVANSIDNFISAHSGAFSTVDITLSRSGDTLVMTGTIEGDVWSSSFENTAGDLTADSSTYQAAATDQARVDTITLTGTTGTANVTVSTVLEIAEIVETVVPTTNWNTRDGTENQPIIELITDEIANQYSRPTQLIQMGIQETAQAIQVNPVGVFQDDLGVTQNWTDVRDLGEWIKYNCTLLKEGNYSRYTTTGTDSRIELTGLTIKGWEYWNLSIRYKVISGTPTNTDMYWSTSGHGSTAGFKQDTALTADGEWHTLILDMSNPSVGGTDWIDNVITGIRFDVSDAHPVIVDFDWIGFTKTYMLNRGSFDVKNRFWDIDLIEIL